MVITFWIGCAGTEGYWLHRRFERQSKACSGWDKILAIVTEIQSCWLLGRLWPAEVLSCQEILNPTSKNHARKHFRMEVKTQSGHHNRKVCSRKRGCKENTKFLLRKLPWRWQKSSAHLHRATWTSERGWFGLAGGLATVNWLYNLYPGNKGQVALASLLFARQ